MYPVIYSAKVGGALWGEVVIGCWLFVFSKNTNVGNWRKMKGGFLNPPLRTIGNVE